LKAAVGFNVESDSWKTLSHSDESFGYQVVQRQSDLLVSAPQLQHENNKTGQIFQCSTDSCLPLFTAEQRAAVNTSLGLVMTLDPSTQNTKACGPTIPRDCKTITMYNGLCYEINRDNTIVKSYPSTTEECRTQADIAFLLDGSGSVANDDFFRMKIFVKNLIRTFLGRDTQFAITQFSGSPTTHYYFNTFSTSNWESQIDNINQLRGGTFTAKAIQNVVDDVFSPQKGSRSNVKRILIVITDGESNDRQNLPAATQSADRKNILRFAIGVGNAFTSPMARQELIAIASQPADNFVFQVGSFDALDRVRETLQDKIDSIEVVKVGIDELLDVTVSVKNRGENSYSSRIILTYPVGLSYRKVTPLEGRIECNSVDSEDGVTKGKTLCSIDKPIFKSNSMAIFIVSYGFNTNSDLSRKIEVTANATRYNSKSLSDNNRHSSSSEVYKNKGIDVKYSVFVTIESYNNFTFGENAVQKPLEQKIKVFNTIRPLNLTVVIKVPVKLGDKDIWMDMSSFQIQGCQSSRDEKPTVTDFVDKIKEKKILDCTVAKCRVFRCSNFMERNKDKTYTISANISSGWIEQKCTVLKAAVGFNVDSGSWKTLSQSDESFGYQVVQRRSDLLVSAPLLQYGGNKRGRIYQCNTGGSCSNLVALEQRAVVNMSLGLAMANDPLTQNT
ncbi:hypothetical protein CCH79_00017460, partial [Gambusia affinis]